MRYAVISRRPMRLASAAAALLLAAQHAPAARAFLVPHGAARARHHQTQNYQEHHHQWWRSACGSPTRLMADLRPLAEEGEWAAYLDDETTGLIYYFNSQTGESLWEPPTATFPAPKLDSAQERARSQKRAEYEKGLAEAEAGGDGGGGFFSSVFGGGGGGGGGGEDPAADVGIGTETETRAGGFSLGSVFASRDSEPAVDEGAYIGDFKEVAVAAKKPARRGSIFGGGLPKENALIVPEDSPIKIEVASKVLPSPEKVSWGGEDAVFTKGRTFGVFDGVSGAEKEEGRALYSRTLASQVKDLVGNEGTTIGEMREYLKIAADVANMEATGASTATIASVGEDGYLRVLNLGDCVVAVFRDGKAVSKTKEILHYFDCPYQLAEDSPDRPRDGTALTFKVEPGDIIVGATDGVFDNLLQGQVGELIAGTAAPKAGALASKIVSESRAVSQDPQAPTPYAKQAKNKRGYENYRNGVGGKVDDIGCVVVRCL